MIVNRTVDIKTKGDTDIIDITPDIARNLSGSGLREGAVTVFSAHTTCGVTIMEYEPGLLADFKKAWERLVPKDIPYDHDARWHDGNGHSHVRASMLGFSVSIPFAGGRMMLGEWQQIVLVDFDNRPRERHIILQFNGE